MNFNTGKNIILQTLTDANWVCIEIVSYNHKSPTCILYRVKCKKQLGTTSYMKTDGLYKITSKGPVLFRDKSMTVYNSELVIVDIVKKEHQYMIGRNFNISEPDGYSILVKGLTDTLLSDILKEIESRVILDGL